MLKAVSLREAILPQRSTEVKPLYQDNNKDNKSDVFKKVIIADYNKCISQTPTQTILKMREELEKFITEEQQKKVINA